MGEDDATVARHLELGGEPVQAANYLEKAARRALAANALSEAVRLAEKSLDFAEDKPTQFARAQLLDEAWIRLDARAGERDTAVRAMQDAVYDEASEVRALGARVRYEDACGGGPDTSARPRGGHRERAKAAGLFDEEARSAADARGALRVRRRARQGARVGATRSSSSRSARHSRRRRRRVADARRRAAGARRRRRGARGAAERGARGRGGRSKTREATLTINVGFALTTMGAKEEARVAIEGGIALAQAVGSPGTVRHGQMNLLCWAATFGAEPRSTRCSPIRARSPTTPSRARGCRTIARRSASSSTAASSCSAARSAGDATAREPPSSAHARCKTAAGGYRATKMLDVVPVALGLWGEAERRCGHAERAASSRREAAGLLEHGSPSLLNEAPIYLALHDALRRSRSARGSEGRDRARPAAPRHARARSLAARRYAKDFLTHLAPERRASRRRRGYGICCPPRSPRSSRADASRRAAAAERDDRQRPPRFSPVDH